MGTVVVIGSLTFNATEFHRGYLEQRPSIADFCNTLECLSLPSLSSPAQCLRARQRSTQLLPFRCSTLWQVPGLTDKHLTTLEKFVTDKNSSFLQKYVNYGCLKLYSTCPTCLWLYFLLLQWLLSFVIFYQINLTKIILDSCCHLGPML